MITSERKRNTLFEIYRLLAALWVAYYHGYRITIPERFGEGLLAVEFFFILSGFFFYSSYKKYKDKPFIKGTLLMVWDKFKPISITFVICSVFAMIYAFSVNKPLEFLGFLWFIPILYLVMFIFILFDRLSEKNKIYRYMYLVLTILCGCYYLFGNPITFMCRSIFCFSLGYYLSKIPKLKISNILSLTISLIIFAITFIISFYPFDPTFKKYMLTLLFFPLLIYFTNHVSFSNNTINYICSINLNIYFYQTVARVLEYYKIITDERILLIIVIIISIVDMLIKKFIKNRTKSI